MREKERKKEEGANKNNDGRRLLNEEERGTSEAAEYKIQILNRSPEAAPWSCQRASSPPRFSAGRCGFTYSSWLYFPFYLENPPGSWAPIRRSCSYKWVNISYQRVEATVGGYQQLKSTTIAPINDVERHGSTRPAASAFRICPPFF